MKRILSLLMVCAIGATAGCGSLKQQPIEWKTYKFEPFRFSLESPFEFSKDLGAKKNESVEVQKMFLQTDPNRQLNGKFFVVTIVSLQTRNEIAVPVEKLTESAVEEMKGSKVLLSGLETDSQPSNFSGIPAITTTGTYKMFHTIPARMLMVNLIDKTWMWQVNIQYPDKDDEAQAAATRILQSLKIADAAQ